MFLVLGRSGRCRDHLLTITAEPGLAKISFLDWGPSPAGVRSFALATSTFKASRAAASRDDSTVVLLPWKAWGDSLPIVMRVMCSVPPGLFLVKSSISSWQSRALHNSRNCISGLRLGFKILERLTDGLSFPETSWPFDPVNKLLDLLGRWRSPGTLWYELLSW